MLNDQTILEAAQELGRQLVQEKSDIEDRVRRLFTRILSRPATDEETKLLIRFFQTQQARFARKELDPAAIAGDGPGEVHERAAWTALARVLFNLDDFQTRE
jgi:hypothetical protein